jgi:cyclic pyranopterin phosphate synthase
MLAWCGDRAIDLTLIETMPLGHVDEDRADRFLPLTAVHARSDANDSIADPRHDRPAARRAIGAWPALGTRLGLISPLTGNFCADLQPRPPRPRASSICASAMRIRSICEGDPHRRLAEVDAIASHGARPQARAHDFRIAPGGARRARHMSVTGG